MDLDALANLTTELADFSRVFHSAFGRRETRQTFDGVLFGLITSPRRKNGWELAHAAGDLTPHAIHRFFTSAKWDADEVLALYQDFIRERCGARGALIFDETGFLKKGRESVGVQRQYSGTAGRVENCQIGVFAAWITPRAHSLFDRRLFLPQSWDHDAERCERAHVPDSIEHRTKPELALEMFESALERGLEPVWVGGDHVYGDDSRLRARVAEVCDYAFCVGSRLCASWQASEAEAPVRASLAELVAMWPDSSWFEASAGPGSKGERTYRWAAERVTEPAARGQAPRSSVLLVRQRGADAKTRAYYLCHGDEGVELQAWVERVGERWPIEQCFEEAKQEFGLDGYEVRRWEGWHRHITLSMLAHGFAGVQRARVREEASAKKPRAPSGVGCSGRRSV